MKVTLNVMFCFFNYFYLMKLKENIALLVDKMIYCFNRVKKQTLVGKMMN